MSARERVSLAHDYLLVMRGAERTFAAMAERYADAPISTLLYDEAGTGGRFAGRDVRTSILQHLGAGQSNFRRLLPLYPPVIRRMKAPACDAVLSSSSAFAHGIAVPSGAVHVCYCHAPFRYAWYEEGRALSETPMALHAPLRAELAYMRRWDRAASERVDVYVANSELTRQRIADIYGRESTIVHPPVETGRFAPGTPGPALLVVCELVRHKRVQVALEAAERAGAPIDVVGSGPDRDSLQASFPNARFLGRVDDEQLARLYSGARAVIVANREEFGITAVEAQAAGRPVLAARAGGALETVIEGETGMFFELDDARGLAAAIERLDEMQFDCARLTANAERFSVAAFQQRLSAIVSESIGSVERPRSLL